MEKIQCLFQNGFVFYRNDKYEMKKKETFRIYDYNTVYFLKIFVDLKECHYFFPFLFFVIFCETGIVIFIIGFCFICMVIRQLRGM